MKNLFNKKQLLTYHPAATTVSYCCVEEPRIAMVPSFLQSGIYKSHFNSLGENLSGNIGYMVDIIVSIVLHFRTSLLLFKIRLVCVGIRVRAMLRPRMEVVVFIDVKQGLCDRYLCKQLQVMIGWRSCKL